MRFDWRPVCKIGVRSAHTEEGKRVSRSTSFYVEDAFRRVCSPHFFVGSACGTKSKIVPPERKNVFAGLRNPVSEACAEASRLRSSRCIMARLVVASLLSLPCGAARRNDIRSMLLKEGKRIRRSAETSIGKRVSKRHDGVLPGASSTSDRCVTFVATGANRRKESMLGSCRRKEENGLVGARNRCATYVEDERSAPAENKPVGPGANQKIRSLFLSGLSLAASRL